MNCLTQALKRDNGVVVGALLFKELKIDGHGQAKILTPEEIEELFSVQYSNDRDRALYAVMLYTACRVSEAVKLRKRDVYGRKGQVRPVILFRKGNTKGKLATRSVPVIEDLRRRLEEYEPREDNPYLFAGYVHGNRCDTYLHQDSAQWLLKKACNRIGIEGVSSHSFRRTALTQMSNAGIPLRIIQEISGHRTLDELYKYLEVREDQMRGAVASLSVLSPPNEKLPVKSTYHEESVSNHNTPF